MDNKTFEKAKQIIDLRRYEAENNAVNNKIKALENRDFKILYECYVTKMIENAKLGKNGEDEKLKKEIYSKLAKLGIDSIEPKYSCTKCNDTGFVEGKACSCLIKEINENRTIYSL